MGVTTDLAAPEEGVWRPTRRLFLGGVGALAASVGLFRRRPKYVDLNSAHLPVVAVGGFTWSVGEEFEKFMTWEGGPDDAEAFFSSIYTPEQRALIQADPRGTHRGPVVYPSVSGEQAKAGLSGAGFAKYHPAQPAPAFYDDREPKRKLRYGQSS